MSDVRPAWLLIASVIALAPAASAEGPSDAEPYPPEVTLAPRTDPSRGEPWRTRPLAFEVSSSHAGPYGLLGAAVEYSASPSFAIASGGGLSAWPLGPRVGLMARVRPLIIGGFASGVEAGSSLGRHAAVEDCEQDPCDSWEWDVAAWGHIALFAGYRSPGGWLVRFAGGASSLFNVADGECTQCGDGATPSFGVTTQPYLGASVGFAPRL